MTTEILRSMLYAGSDVIRDLEWVIFDEESVSSFFEQNSLEMKEGQKFSKLDNLEIFFFL